MNQRIENDAHTDYHAARSRARDATVRGVWKDRFQPRWVPLSERTWNCDMPREAIEHLSTGKHFMSYRGLPMGKNPLDLTLYQTLFYEVQPATVIELGAYTGASGLWIRDTLDVADISARVIAVDIDLSLVEPMAKDREGLEFREGDCDQIELLFSPNELANLPHPLILIDDAHVNVNAVYEHFHEHAMCAGDYLIVEDTIPWIPGSFTPDEKSKEWGDWKWQEMQAFFRLHADDYAVDRYYTDFYGYNATWNWNGFLKRVDGEGRE